MHQNSTYEYTVGGSALLFSSVAVSDPFLDWLQGHWQRLAVVSLATMFVAIVTCLLKPAATTRETAGRILAAGVVGALATAIWGAMSSFGNSPAAIGATILVSGIGAYLLIVFILELLVRLKESDTLKQGVLSAVFHTLSRMVPAVPQNSDGTKLPPSSVGPPTETIFPQKSISAPSETGPSK